MNMLMLSLQVNQGVSIVRPPGHHAEVDESCGFCFFNTTAIAAKYAQKAHGVKNVLILDWDIHHGNGIQHIFYEDSSVLYISLHRFDNGEYFPGLREGNYDYVGSGSGKNFPMRSLCHDYKHAQIPIDKQFSNALCATEFQICTRIMLLCFR